MTRTAIHAGHQAKVAAGAAHVKETGAPASGLRLHAHNPVQEAEAGVHPPAHAAAVKIIYQGICPDHSGDVERKGE